MNKIIALADFRQPPVKFRCRSCSVTFAPTAKQHDYCGQCASYQKLAYALNTFNGNGGNAA